MKIFSFVTTGFKSITASILFCYISLHLFGQDISLLPVRDRRLDQASTVDWLVRSITEKAGVYRSADSRDIVLFNGLVRRTFRLTPNVACIDYNNMTTGQQLLRSVKSEARLIINGKEYKVGGLNGQKENAYLMESWVDHFTAGPHDFLLKRWWVAPVTSPIQWKCNTWASKKNLPSGTMLSFTFESGDADMKGLFVTIHYELYDGLPLIVKWLSLENSGSSTFKINRVVNEILGLTEEESAVVGTPEQMKKQHGIYVETNYAFNNAMRYDISDQTTHWNTDSAYTSQVNYNFQTPCLLEIYPEKAPGIDLHPGDSFQSVRTLELLMDSYDRERRGLAIRRMYSTLAPWTTQNPIFMHLVSKNDEEVKNAIDQCVLTGYEAVILSFGSHCNMEDSSPQNLDRWKHLADYAHSRGIQLGGYSLFSSRRIDDETDVIDPKTGKPGGAFFGNAPCFGSKWGLAYRDKIKKFFTQTGFDIWENDGAYPGDICASITHPGHKGLEDSQWRQMEIQKELYHWLNERGVYINAPDWYFLDGTHKIAIGYREVNFSLSRDQQKILNRQNIYDGTWEKTPSMGWGFVPLTRYQGGGPDAVLEPLYEHLADYRQLMFQYYGAGVQACYRGPRLYDTDFTRRMVSETINWYKKYRDILNSDIIHLRRADGRDWDGFLHVNPNLPQKAFLVLFNPTSVTITQTIKVPLYYSGLSNDVTVKEKDQATNRFVLNARSEINLNVTLPPDSYSWYVME